VNVEFLPKILKTVQAVDMRPHSSLNNRTRNFSCWTSNILQENKWFSKAFQVHPVFTITITLYSPLLSIMYYHSLLLHHPPAAVGMAFFSGAEKTCPSTDRCRYDVARLDDAPTLGI